MVNNTLKTQIARNSKSYSLNASIIKTSLSNLEARVNFLFRLLSTFYKIIMGIIL